MALTLSGFNAGAESSGGLTIHFYKTTDFLGDVLTTDYFDGVKDIIRSGDLMYVYSTTQKEYMQLRCLRNADYSITVTQLSNQSQGNLVISIGSSLTSQGLVDTAGYFGWDVAGPVEWAMRRSNQRCRYVNKGVSGQNTTQMIARLNDDVLVHRPAAVIVQNGTNEVNTGIDALKVTSKTMYERILASGAHLIVCATQTRDKALSGWSDDELEAANALNEFKRRFCESNDRAYFADVTKYVADPTDSSGQAASNMLRDGIHYTPKGAYAAGEVIKEIIEAIFPPTDVLSNYALGPEASDFIYGNELPNPMFAGTSGTTNTGVSGNVPTSWTVERVGGTSAGTVACSIAARSALDIRRELTMTYTPGGATGTEEFYLRTSSATLTADNLGELYESLIAIDVSAWDGWKFIRLEVDDQSTVNKAYVDGYNLYDETMPEFAWSGVLRIPEVPFLTGGQRYRLRVGIDSAASSTGVIKVHSPIMRGIDPDTSLVIPRNEMQN